jgi:hypothetical protein
LQIIGGALVRQQEDDEVDLFAVHRAVMHNPIEGSSTSLT